MKKLKKGFSLVPANILNSLTRDKNIDFDKEMKRIQNEFADNSKAEEIESKKELLNAFKGLGYEIKL